jgi:hypothetical protein
MDQITVSSNWFIPYQDLRKGAAAGLLFHFLPDT